MPPGKASIQFFTEGTSYSLRDRALVRKWLAKICASHHRKLAELNYIFVSDKVLLKMNQQYLKHNTLTDIITFPSTDSREIGGDIFISIDRVKDNAFKYKVSIKDELHRVMAHGLLHLCGFSDKSALEKNTMRSQEEKALDLRTF